MARKTIHGIDLYAPGGLEALFAYRRAQFGDAQMNANAGDSASAAGGDGAGAPGGEAGGSTPATPPAAPPPAPAPDSGESGESKPPANETPEQKATRLEAEVERLRKENGRSRVDGKTQAAEEARNDLVQQLGKALGFVKEGERAPTAEQLVKDLAEATEKGQQAELELAVHKRAGKLGADVEALLDSRSFLAAIKGLDPAKGEDLDNAIKKAVGENPKLKASQAGAAGGADIAGGSGESSKKSNSLEAAVRKRLG